MRQLLSVLVAISAVAGCAPTYTTPGASGTAVEKDIVIDAPFDEAWRAMVQHAGSSFFAIDSVEKDSGLITLSFGAGQPGRFIDCGSIAATNFSGEAGPFVHLAEISPTARTDFDGRINLVMRPVSADQTRLTINSRYVYEVTTESWGSTWAFDAEGSDTKAVIAGFGTYPVTCRATGEAERAILAGVPAGPEASPAAGEPAVGEPEAGEPAFTPVNRLRLDDLEASADSATTSTGLGRRGLPSAYAGRMLAAHRPGGPPCDCSCCFSP